MVKRLLVHFRAPLLRVETSHVQHIILIPVPSRHAMRLTCLQECRSLTSDVKVVHVHPNMVRTRKVGFSEERPENVFDELSSAVV